MTAATLDATAATAELTRGDRCDRCGARAFVRVTIPAADGMELLFCGHHFTRNELQLLAAGATVRDERHRINESPSVSASA